MKLIYSVYYIYKTTETTKHVIHFESESEAKKFLTMATNSQKIVSAFIYTDVVQVKYDEWMEKMINL